MESILKDMLKFAQYYNYICNPQLADKSYGEILGRIKFLGVKTCVPLLMDLMDAKEEGYISNDDMTSAFMIIENYIVRRTVCGLKTNMLNKVFVQLGNDIKKNMENDGLSYFDAFVHQLLRKTGEDRFPSNQEFSDNFSTYQLYKSNRNMCKYILERLENYKNRERVDVVSLIDNQELTIEHIMPQTLSDDWKKMLGENWELIQSKYLHTIGNLTLTAYNSDYSNTPFIRKKEMPKKGFLYSKLSLNEFVKECEKWGEDEIVERSQILYKKAEDIWWIPEDIELGHDEDEWYDWDEDFEVTNKKIIQINVADSIIATKDMTDAYKKINSTLYDLDPEIYQNSSISWFSRIPENFRKPFQIGENAFIETNRSSSDKLSYIKNIAELFGFSSDDIRFLVHTEPEEK